MEWWQAVILGLVEGLTEFLPVSSTGHLIIASWMLGLDETGSKRAVDTFLVVVQAGAIAAVLALYWPRVVQMIRGLVGLDRDGLRLAGNLVVAFLPAAALGLALGSAIKDALFTVPVVLVALAVGGIVMILLDHRRQPPREGRIEDLTWRQALLIGLMQAGALIPGTSRAMMSILGGVLAGLPPKAAAEFSFLLALPTLGAACAYSAARSLARGEHFADKLGPSHVLLGMFVAFLSALVSVRWMMAFLNRHGLTPFGVYRIALALALLALALWGGVTLGR